MVHPLLDGPKPLVDGIGTEVPAITPRNAVHTLRRIPLAGSRSASPRPLPSCRSTAPPTATCRNTQPTVNTRRQALPCASFADLGPAVAPKRSRVQVHLPPASASRNRQMVKSVSQPLRRATVPPNPATGCRVLSRLGCLTAPLTSEQRSRRPRRLLDPRPKSSPSPAAPAFRAASRSQPPVPRSRCRVSPHNRCPKRRSSEPPRRSAAAAFLDLPNLPPGACPPSRVCATSGSWPYAWLASRR